MNTENLKPFNLEAALQGEPVMLRDGRKAFVRHHETELPTGSYLQQIWGATINEDGFVMLTSWSKDGSYSIDGYDSGLDIIGMYEAKATHIVNGFEVPAPETGAPNVDSWFYVPSLSRPEFVSVYVWNGDENRVRWLERGLVFLSKEAAIANAKAMLGINPYEEV